MSRYGKPSQKFRVRASWPQITTFAVIATVLAREVAAAFVWMTETALAWMSGWTSVFLLFTPFAAPPAIPYYSAPPLDTPFSLGHMIVPGAALALAVIAAFIWPTSARLATRLFVLIVSTELVRTAAVGTAVASILSAAGIPFEPVHPDMTTPVALIILAAAVFVFTALSRALIRTFGPSLDIGTTSVRFLAIAVVFAVPTLILSAVELAAGYRIGIPASAVLIVVATAAALFRWQTVRWENVHSHGLTKVIALLAIVTVLAVGTSLWIFRGPLTGSDYRAVWIEEGVTLVEHDEILRRQLRDLKSLEKREEMRLEWTNERERPAGEVE